MRHDISTSIRRIWRKFGLIEEREKSKKVCVRKCERHTKCASVKKIRLRIKKVLFFFLNSKRV